MDRERAPTSRGRLNVRGMLLRRSRIFARLRVGSSYEEIAAEEGLTITRIRQIVAEVLQKRAIDSGADHAKLQLERLGSAMQLATEAIAAGDISAIGAYLKVLDRLDRYQSVAVVHQKYDDEARKKLLDKINRVVANLGVGEVGTPAAGEHWKTTGDEPGEAGGEEAPEARPAEEQQKGQGGANAWMSV
jgi:hypothetical protein